MGNTQDICLGREHKGPVRYAELSPEEAYMLKRQQDLKLFVFTCHDLESAFLTNLYFRSINEKEYLDILVKLKLLRADKPNETLLWQNFYCRFKIDATDSGVLKSYYDITALMIALYLLTSSKASVKAKYIGALYHNYRQGANNEGERVSFGQNNDESEYQGNKLQKFYKPAEYANNDMIYKKHYLRKNQEIRQIFTIFTAVSLNLLPFFASDYPDDDKSHFYKVYCQWNENMEGITEYMIENFCRSDSQIDIVEFVKRAIAFPQYFDVLGIREEVKRDIQIREENHLQMNSDDEEDNNKKDKLYNLPSRYAQAYLYKLISLESKKNGILVDKSRFMKNESNLNSKQYSRESISGNLMKNIQRSDYRTGNREIWEAKISLSEEKRRDRATRQQNKARLVHDPSESQF
ncbi:UNKNOWN [Stylonychia lemnae]|uniref:Uncharacterized protein n=1 Tax=Stylonychia lemnae TaxID=5949 RepID=A0A078A8X3_STYLE|nr:UNKNOWN [Stylonychia lemnae]|eukprot:CDW78725.1 UNKNOWN [Stylonychia lemnae]